jgi:hypothetical protein
MFRLCSLWFNNPAGSSVRVVTTLGFFPHTPSFHPILPLLADPTVNFKLSESLQEGLPSRKFVPLIYQIASRIHAAPTEVAKVIFI